MQLRDHGFAVVLRVAVATGALAAVGATALHCDNGASGVEACRAIEDRRCEAALGCSALPIDTEDDVHACKLFYRDQCEFGVADGKDPDAVELDACLTAIEQATACQGASNLLDCPGDDPLAVAGDVDQAATTACFLIECPEYLADCAFLKPNKESLAVSDRCATPPSSSGSGGSGGSGGSSGGSGGSGTGGSVGGSSSGGAGGSASGGSGGSGG